MPEENEKIKEGLHELRDRVKKVRHRLTGGVIEKRAKKAGVDIVGYADSEIDKLESTLRNLNQRFEIWVYQYKETLQFELKGLEDEVKDLRQNLKLTEKHQTPEKIEEKTEITLEELDKKFKNFYKKLKDHLDWDSDFDLTKNLK